MRVALYKSPCADLVLETAISAVAPWAPAMSTPSLCRPAGHPTPIRAFEQFVIGDDALVGSDDVDPELDLFSRTGCWAPAR